MLPVCEGRRTASKREAKYGCDAEVAEPAHHTFFLSHRPVSFVIFHRALRGAEATENDQGLRMPRHVRWSLDRRIKT